MGYFKTRSNYYTERENLNSYLIVYVLSGKGYLKYDDESYTMCEGQSFFIDCMKYQYYKADTSDPWEILWVHFNGGTSCGYYQQFAQSNSPICNFEKDCIVPSIIRQLILTHQEKNIKTEPLTSKLLVDLLTEFLFNISAPNSPKPFLPKFIKDIMNYLDKNLTDKTTLDMLAKECSISKYYLEKEFKKYIGVTPNEYLILNRISLAKELLKYSEIPVSEIASKLGIHNTSHLINLFKEREGITPLAFRKRWNGTRYKSVLNRDS
ncbi:AraC family transcriptional regulator [Clostridium sp.]|uniref:AraC family transcriptional regulator n=1 Tax=Clostridium sp. TaxID=1506 RepID=UPI003FD79291